MRSRILIVNNEPGRRQRPILAVLLLLPGLLAAGLAYAGDAVLRLSEPVAITDDAEIFGSLLDESLPVASLEELARHEDPDSAGAFLLTTRVSQVCKKKGCFFIAQQGTTTMRVSFVDYSFFVPTDISGKNVTLSGRLVRRELTEEQAEHFAKDLGDGKPVPVEAGTVNEIVATAVSVPR